MGIEFKGNPRTEFDKIAVGKCFRYDGKIYLKIGYDEHHTNVFNISDNHSDQFMNQMLVEIIDVKIVLS